LRWTQSESGVTNRFVGRGALGGGLLGLGFGAGWGFLGFGGLGGAIAGGIGGILIGMLLGLIGGLSAGVIAWTMGKR
jgi:hypothetical protein